jgi:hypothetical protein
MGRSLQVELRDKSKGNAVHCDGMSWKKVEINTFEIRAYLTDTEGGWQSVNVRPASGFAIMGDPRITHFV